MSQADELLAKLGGEKFRREVQEWANQVWSAAQAFYCGDVDGSKDLEGNWQGSLDMSMNTYGQPEDIFSVITRDLASPRIITSEELPELFSVYLDADDRRICEDFDALYECFIDHFRYRVLTRRSSDFDVCDVRVSEEQDDETTHWYVQLGMAFGKAEILGTTPEIPSLPESNEDESGDGTTAGPVIRLGSEIGLSILGIRRSSQMRGLSTKHIPVRDVLVARIEGRISKAAIGVLHAEIEPILRSMLGSVGALGAAIPVALEAIRENWVFVSECVRLLFSDSISAKKPKDSINRRIGIAVRLLAEADRQPSEAIKLALCITALEALLGRKGADISKTLSECVAVLLEPVPNNRQKAAEYVKELYDQRSRTLHGESLVDGGSLSQQARLLAAGCLYGLWFRNDFLRRLGQETDTPDKLLKELMDRRFDGSRPDGVPDLQGVRRLWTK